VETYTDKFLGLEIVSTELKEQGSFGRGKKGSGLGGGLKVGGGLKGGCAASRRV